MRSFAFIIISLLLSLPSFALSVGTVDMQKVLFSIKEGKRIRKQLEKSFNKKKKDLKGQENKLKKSKEEFDKKAKIFDQKTREKKQVELQKMLVALETKRQRYQKEISEMEKKLTSPVVKKIYTVVNQVAKASKMDVAFEVSTSPILYAKNKQDLTGKVIKAYDKKHPAK